MALDPLELSGACATFHEVYKTKKGKLCIVMDYADGGDIADKIKKQRGRNFSENKILDWFT